jgi:hypothetical protein
MYLNLIGILLKHNFLFLLTFTAEKQILKLILIYY